MLVVGGQIQVDLHRPPELVVPVVGLCKPKTGYIIQAGVVLSVSHG
ncbi:hypothetical protein SDC9_182837 [bioreactor metagenome]|uniref:Uncharacterized protein n=1 Tax=bioreactor metagenome TaxID=1076179 RepID=A0A645HB36_9ZZZZ